MAEKRKRRRRRRVNWETLSKTEPISLDRMAEALGFGGGDTRPSGGGKTGRGQRLFRILEQREKSTGVLIMHRLKREDGSVSRYQVSKAAILCHCPDIIGREDLARELKRIAAESERKVLRRTREQITELVEPQICELNRMFRWLRQRVDALEVAKLDDNPVNKPA